MGKLFYLMGKSASGKDTMYRRLKAAFPELRSVVMYTTRPKREGERNGREYFFSGEEELMNLTRAGKIIELRTYQTIHGPWKYFTADDGQIDVREHHYLLMGTLESYLKMRAYFGADVLVPLYLQLEDGDRLGRALQREKRQKIPKYEELCRRFLADAKDFSKERIQEAGIERIFDTGCMEACFQEICLSIRANLCYNTCE